MEVQGDPTYSPNFDCLKDQFSVTKALLTDADVKGYEIYAHGLGKWFGVQYQYIQNGVIRGELTDTDHQYVAIADLRRFLDELEIRGHNILLCDWDGVFRSSNGVVFSPEEVALSDERYGDDADDKRLHKVLLDSLSITGAVAPGNYVIGEWHSIYKPILLQKDVKRTREAIRLHLQLREHPHVIPMEALVVDDTNHIRGYTIPFLPGGTLRERDKVRREWFVQLMKTTDDINFKHHIIHCDLSPKNLLVSPSQKIQVIDFDLVGCNMTFDFDALSVICTAYEVITKRILGDTIDGDFSSYYLIACCANNILDRSISWAAGDGVQLDFRPEEIRDFLVRWRESRMKEGYSWMKLVEDYDRAKSGGGPVVTFTPVRCRTSAEVHDFWTFP